MKYNITIAITFFVLIIVFSSCQKVINLDLNSASPQIVIEGNVYDQSGPYLVKISQTVNFDESNVYSPVTGAIVEISDNDGNSEILTEPSSGSYITSALQGVSGRTYTLTVISKGKTYTASSTMPNPVNIDSIYLEKNMFGNEKIVSVNFTDPVNISNYYHLIEFINNGRQTGFNVTDDNLNQGEIISYSFMSAGNVSKLETGDNVTVWLESIDENVYEYFRTAGRDGGQSSSPSNPTSNISNGALGYFNACSVRTISIIAQ
ncbi:MAG: hypothetical protein A2W98_10030 [Bacteroidetes bacterium GWF2_33_38]|nr:MAG: hypothetical protein A2W98_10030 [Bacteroidetes bacterium GWF2_33_38]OFY74553.1 MAG: hypothetical protein A2265_04625 [Bacteroidetes bacterium RIFOXYA12_FULL_33_9]OFY91618.1 MAG: hypothetical protein A2236_11505 [Bacteroidetes bacterium RIFOXYA2_FULL_33_7]HBX52576.1 DUF4249 domain-containing protein [Bacteroidales bacterium]